MSVQADQDMITGPVPLTPIQRWFFETNLRVPQHFNQSLLLEVHTHLEPTVLEAGIQHLLKHHDALRMRFHRDAAAWKQVNAADEQQEVFMHVDLSSSSAAEQAAALDVMAAQLQASLDLERGPLVRVALFHFGVDEPDRLLLIIHHLVVDGVSWRILLADLQTVYRQLEASQAVALPPKTSSFKQWAERLQAYAQGDGKRAALEYWLAAAREAAWALPVDIPRGSNTVATARTVTVSLTADETQALLQQAPEAYRTQINDLLLTALAQTVSRWSGIDGVWVDLEGHGREPLFEDLDLTRTVGWFTTLFPVRLNLGGVAGPGGAIKAIKEQLRQVPRKGLDYGVLRYLSDEPELKQAIAAIPQPKISFNYLGQFDQVISDDALFRPVRGTQGREQHEQELRGHLFDIVGSVLGGELSISWTYSAEQYRAETIEALAQGFIGTLRELIAHCLLPDAGGYTPSDFPEAALPQNELDRLIAAYERRSNDD